jgi:hypothetical protein
MRFAIGFMLAGLSAAQPPSTSLPLADPKLHADVLRLVELAGSRAAMQNGLPKLIEQGKAKVTESCGGCDPRFVEEWGRRMTARLNLDDFVNVIVRVYEKYLTDAEVLQLIASRTDNEPGQEPRIPAELLQKLTNLAPSMDSEIVGGTTQIGAKLGSEIGLEITKEHPEYLKNAAAAK